MSTIHTIGKHLTLAVDPLREAIMDIEHFKIVLYRMGWGVDSIPASYQQLAIKIGTAIDRLRAMTPIPDAAQTKSLLEDFKQIYLFIDTIAEAPMGVPDPVTFLNEVRERLFELLLVEYLADHQPAIFNFFKMTGVIQNEFIPGPEDESRPSIIRSKIIWARIPEIIKHPQELPKLIYGWGTPDFNFELFADHALELFYALHIPVSLESIKPQLGELYLNQEESDDLFLPAVKQKITLPLAYLDIAGEDRELGISMLDLPQSGNLLPGIIIQPSIPSEINLPSIRIREDVNLLTRVGSNIASLFGILIRPGSIAVTYPFKDGQLPSVGFGVGIEYAPVNSTFLLGEEKSNRLQLKGASLELSFLFNGNEPELKLAGILKELALVIDPSQSDNFINKLFGGKETTIPINLGFEWSNKFGLKFTGGGGFEVTTYPHLSLGPLSVDQLLIRLDSPESTAPSARLQVGAAIKAKLGPLTMIVEGLGLSLNTRFQRGNAGPLDLSFGAKPPTGVGILIDGGGFTGGGFLYFDYERKEYGGALELSFQDKIALKAIGILNTIMPDGSKGYSLLIIITAEFTPIQLGLGFTLNGVGGLLGLNRTFLIESLQKGIYDGTLSNILFPQDVVANAPMIISQLKNIFPPQEGHFLIGPMAKIGWGTPTIMTLDLGLLIEIPRPGFAILGIFRMVLPDAQRALIKVRVDFVGYIDLEKGQISFDGSLVDSKILSFALSGDMAFRLYYKGQPNFLLSIGGFHPAYTPPPMNLPEIKRISIIIFSGNPSLKTESYFAVTSNTVQFGSRAELNYSFKVFNVYGFLGYDVLLQLSPLYFIADFQAMLAVRSGSSVLFSIKVHLILEGPTPWHASGDASFEIGFIFTVTIKVHFDVTFGESRNDRLPAVEIMPLLKEALSQDKNWSGGLSDQFQLFTMRPLPENEFAIQPSGAIHITQKIIPLRLEVTRFGYQSISGVGRFDITQLLINGIPVIIEYNKEQFAPAQYIDMSDSEKLSRPSFELFDAGISAAGTDSRSTDYGVAIEVNYEIVYIPEKQEKVKVKMDRNIFDTLLDSNAIQRSPLGQKRKKTSALGHAPVRLKQEEFAIVDTVSLSLYNTTMRYESVAAAQEALKELATKDKRNKTKLQVMSTFEFV